MRTILLLKTKPPRGRAGADGAGDLPSARLAALSLRQYASTMLQKLRTGPGFRVAIVIAAFAALCLVAPPAVMAFGHGNNTLHCLSNADTVDHGMHGGAARKDHGDHAKLPGTKAPGCCGLYCLSALPLASGPVVEGLFVAPALSLPAETALFGRVPSRPDRPPIPLLSV